MENFKTLIILDWDDTLFPTTWLVKNNINLTDDNVQNQYIVFFSRLDLILSQVLLKLTKYGQVVIVTNAASKWILVSSNLLPNTQKLIKEKLLVISAREFYQEKYPDQMILWKKLIFKQLVSSYFLDNLSQNIISIGDADYEFYALIDLYDEQSIIKKRLLKTVRFLKEPSFEDLIDQLDVLNNSLHKLLICNKHMDLKFKDIKTN